MKDEHENSIDSDHAAGESEVMSIDIVQACPRGALSDKRSIQTFKALKECSEVEVIFKSNVVK